MSITSPLFILLALSLPILRRNNIKYYKYFYLLLNMVFVYFASNNLISFCLLIIYALFAYYGKKYIKNKRIVCFVLVLMFLYFRGYPLITENLSFIYPKTIELFALSYVMFKTISYLYSYIDLELLSYINYVFSFHTITSGPVQECDDFLEDYDGYPNELSVEEIINCLLKIMWGYIQVLGIAYLCKKYCDLYYGKMLLVMFFNFFYVYFNFKGYCDVVSGFGKLTGFTIRKNFDRPYFARGIDEFWRKWNVGLSSWLREHIYFPLGGSRKKEYNTIINTFITFIVSGLWHCFDLNGLVFGLLQGLGVCAFRYYKKFLAKKFVIKDAVNEFRSKKLVMVMEILVTLVFEGFAFMFITMEIL